MSCLVSSGTVECHLWLEFHGTAFNWLSSLEGTSIIFLKSFSMKIHSLRFQNSKVNSKIVNCLQNSKQVNWKELEIEIQRTNEPTKYENPF